MMRAVPTGRAIGTPVVRLTSLSPLAPDAMKALEAAVARASPVRARQELASEGQAMASPLLIVTGWAARVRTLPDGRRQFLSFLLPGDLIGLRRYACPLATSTVVALSDLTICTPPELGLFPSLDEAYGIGEALDQAYLLAQITRLGRLNAHDRLVDLMLELHERLTRSGLARNGSFGLPLTQEIMADALGLTAVHVNRTLQAARRHDDLVWKGGRVTITDPPGISRRLGWEPVKVA
jgi:CRP-like cAMP-binding protein